MLAPGSPNRDGWPLRAQRSWQGLWAMAGEGVDRGYLRRGAGRATGSGCFREEGGVKSAAGEDGDAGAGCRGVLLRKGLLPPPAHRVTGRRRDGSGRAGSTVAEPFAEY